MADSRLYLCCSVLLIFLGCTFDFGIQNVRGLTRHKLSNCYTTNSTNYTVDLKCTAGSVIHVVRETYSNSSSHGICAPYYSNCSGHVVENNRLSSSDFRLQTTCNGKPECSEFLDPSHFNCVGRRMGIVDYECVPESVNYNMCYNLTASSQTNENVFFLASPKSGTSHPILCNCEIRGKNMRVQIVDFRANMMDNEKWVLNITSGFMLNHSTPSNSPFIRLLNNVLGGYHDTVHIQYYSENTSNQNIWIELTGRTDVQMNLSCTSWIYSGTRNTYQPQTSQTGTPVKPSSTHSTNITEAPTANYNTTFTTAFEHTTSTVNKSSQTPTSSVSTSAENTTSTVNKSSQMLTMSVLTSAENTTSTEVTTNDSGAYSSGQSSSRENDQQTIVISVVVVVVASFVSAVVGAVAIVYRKRRNVLKSRDNVTSKRNSNVYSDNDDDAVNTKNDVIQSPNRDQTKKNLQVVVIANGLSSNKPDNTREKSNRPPIKPRKSQAAFNNREVENEGSGDISSELGEHPVSQTNANDRETKVNDKPGTTPKNSSICVPEEEMKDNFLYDMDDDDTQFQYSQKCVPKEEMKHNFLYSMDDTEFQDSQKCVPEEEMKDNFLYDMDDDDMQFQDSLKCVPEEEMKDNFLYNMDDTEFQDSFKCVPEEEMKDNFLYSMDDTEV